MTHVGPISRKNGAEKLNDKIIPSSTMQILNKVEDFNNIIVMSGTATRKSLGKKGSRHEVKLPQKKNHFKDSFSKLRAPFYKSYKMAHTEEKLMTKSCEILLECIKPYKDIPTVKKAKVTESIRVGSVLKMTNIIYEKKATRKFHYFSFSEENQEESFLMHPLRLLPDNISSDEAENKILETEDEGDCKNLEETEISSNETVKTVSSEDFITKVFPQAETSTLI